MQEMKRRTFLGGAAQAAGTAACGGPFQGLAAWAANGRSSPDFRQLGPIPDMRDGEVRFWLPEGFQYRSLNHTEAKLTHRFC